MTVSTPVSRAGSSGYEPPPLNVSVRSDDPSAFVIEVQGELDLFTGPMLHQHLESYNDPSGSNGHPRRVIYLLPDLTFMDARGLHYLLTAFDGHGSETITIREPSSTVCRLLGLVGLDSMVEERENR